MRSTADVDVEQSTVRMRDVWTFEDLQTLDVEDRRRYEIVDGALLVSPTPALRHELVIDNLHTFVRAQAPPDLAALGTIGIRFDRSYRIPDLTVVSRERIDPDADCLRPDEVLLAIEVVSPGSVTSDRITKPAQYAAAGIVHFWRVETDPVGVTIHTLPDGADRYVETGSWGAGETARIEAPFAVEIEIDRLLTG